MRRVMWLEYVYKKFLFEMIVELRSFFLWKVRFGIVSGLKVGFLLGVRGFIVREI